MKMLRVTLMVGCLPLLACVAEERSHGLFVQKATPGEVVLGVGTNDPDAEFCVTSDGGPGEECFADGKIKSMADHECANWGKVASYRYAYDAHSRPSRLFYTFTCH